ncbi:MAG: O-antigen ligase family protein [Bacteroides ovatus]|nr:O-antigen ligase family protein [Bacteroides ovatus]
MGLTIALFAGALSQTPQYYANNSMFTVTWILPAVFALFSGKMTIAPISLIVLCFLVFQLFAFVLDFATSNMYQYRHDVNVEFSPISIFILFIGVQCARLIKKETFCNVLFYSSIVCLPVLDYLVLNSSFNTFGLDGYLQISTYKNQIAPVLISHLCVIALLGQSKSIYLRWIFYVTLLLTAYTVLGLRSRTFMVSMIILLVFLFFSLQNKKERKCYYFLIVLSIVYIIYNWQLFYDMLFTMVFKQSDDLSGISSGRTGLWSEAIIHFFDNPLFGLGQAAGNVENFYLQNLLAFGLLGFPLAVSFVYIPLKTFKAIFLKTDTIHLLTLIVVIIFLVNGIFERTPPVGPGIRCLYFWLLLGYCLSYSYRIKSNERKR